MSGFIIIPYCYDNLPYFISFFYIFVGLGYLFQWKALIQDCFYLSSLNKFLKENQVLSLLAALPEQYFPASCL